MALPASFLDELRARTPIAAVIGRRVKLARSGRHWKGCCPFHNEKTPSFYVYEDGYHCFGCGAHGDAMGFVMHSQGLDFMDAVALLAGEAGLDVPKATPAAAEAERRRHDLHEVLEAAATEYQRRLSQPDGARALDYLHGRGLSDETIRRFGLGWSGDGRAALASDRSQLAEAGLLREAQDGRPPRELFFSRVMFPIRDRRGRVISFGGRTMGDVQPKYLNGPQTAVFSKRRTLFAVDLAREAAAGADQDGSGRVVVVEGYMDVIALHQAGFGAAVAPLGTALTAEQLEELWRLSPVPVLCFDGDDAGRRAIERAAETALPLLAAGRSLMFARLPDGDDPDTLVRRDRADGFRRVLDAARPMADALFDMLREGFGPSPEQRAALSSRLDAAAEKITDRNLAWEYKSFFRDRMREVRPRPVWQRSSPRTKPPLAIQRRPPGGSEAAAERARVLTAILLRHPGLLHDVEEAFETIALPDGLDRLREAFLRWAGGAEVLDFASAMSHLTRLGLAATAAQALSAVPVPLPACASAEAMPAEAEQGWWHFFGLVNPGRLEEEVATAEREFVRQPDLNSQRRLIALCNARDALRRGEHGVEAEI